MYGKLFEQMYDGTLTRKGPWQALITFQQLIILSNRHGEVDMTAEAIAGRTTLPLEVIQIGIQRLLEPDPDSRSKAEEGRRIVPLSPERNWGWRIVNYGHYNRIRSEEERREYHRGYYHDVRRPRKENVESQQPSTSSTRSQQRSTVSTTSTAVDVDVSKSKAIVEQKPLDAAQPVDKSRRKAAIELAKISLAYLNLKSGRSFPVTRSNLVLIEGRILRDGATEAQIKAVIDTKVGEWGEDPKMRTYLRPATLFGAEKWSQYVGQLQAPGKPPERVVHVVGRTPEGARGAIDSFMHLGMIDGAATAKRFLKTHSRLIGQRGYTTIEVQDTNEARSMLYAIEELK